jgi:phage FluMu protein Com
MIHFKCSKCGKKLGAKDDSAGKRVKCPACGQILQAPATGEARRAPPGEPAPAPPAAKSSAVSSAKPKPPPPAIDPHIVGLLAGLGEFRVPSLPPAEAEAVMARAKPVLDELARDDGASALPTLLALANDESQPGDLREWADCALGFISGRSRTVLVQLAQDRSVPLRVRRDSLEQLAGEDLVTAQRMIAQILDDPEQQVVHEDARRILAEAKADRASSVAVALIGLLVSLVLLVGGFILWVWIPFCFALIPMALGVSGIGVSINMLRGKA